jgi:hypothetical protein
MILLTSSVLTWAHLYPLHPLVEIKIRLPGQSLQRLLVTNVEVIPSHPSKSVPPFHWHLAENLASRFIRTDFPIGSQLGTVSWTTIRVISSVEVIPIASDSMDLFPRNGSVVVNPYFLIFLRAADCPAPFVLE